MRLPFRSRLLGALFALWFAFVLGDPGMLHACPMHSAAHGGTGSGTTSGTMPEVIGAQGHAHHDTMSHSDAGGHDAGSPCTCAGQCCISATFARIAEQPSFSLAPAKASADARIATREIDGPASTDVRLPFANGPPGI